MSQNLSYSSALQVVLLQCKNASPTVTIKRIGTMATVIQSCKNCGNNRQFKWRNQPLIHGRHPAGNIMMSFSILMSEVNISQIFLMFGHMGLTAISPRTYFCAPGKVLVSFNFYVLGNVSCCINWEGERYQGCLMVGRWPFWFNGSQCKIWGLYFVLQFHFKVSALWINAGRKISINTAPTWWIQPQSQSTFDEVPW